MSRRVPRPSQERAFLQSVVYASLFDYPLSPSQLRESLVGELADEQTLDEWYDASPRLRAAIEYEHGFYFPRGRRDLLAIRPAREALSRRLLADHARPLALVMRMPFVRMVAISGSLAHLNAERGADLDLFVIAAPRRVWSVTVTTLVVARCLGWRDQLCLNYVVSERALMVSPADLFSANQIVHLQPLSGASLYTRFLEENRFVERFYPNFRPRPVVGPGFTRASLGRAIETLLDWTLAPLYERTCRALYGWHLRRRAHTWRSRDQVRLEAECLKLHTHSHRREVMEHFEQALERAAGDVLKAETLWASDARGASLPITVEAASPVRVAR